MADLYMTPADLLRRIEHLPRDTKRHKAMEQALQIGAGFGRAWYGSQKEHWQRWLAEYSGPGAYGRSARGERPARYVYNHIRCAPMLFWLAEAAGVAGDRLERGYRAVLKEKTSNGGTQCAALRRVIPWEAVFAALEG